MYKTTYNNMFDAHRQLVYRRSTGQRFTHQSFKQGHQAQNTVYQDGINPCVEPLQLLH